MIREKNCGSCQYRAYDIKCFAEIKYFLSKVYPKTEHVYAPSNNTRNHFLPAYSKFKNITNKREHLLFNLKHTALVFNKDNRFADLGFIGEHKGYTE